MKTVDGNLVICGETGLQEMDTRQCVHCGGHWIVVSGSGKLHRYCMKCGGDTCSRLECLMECMPFEAWLDAEERRGR